LGNNDLVPCSWNRLVMSLLQDGAGSVNDSQLRQLREVRVCKRLSAL
jgi:hypothetical protein